MGPARRPCVQLARKIALQGAEGVVAGDDYPVRERAVVGNLSVFGDDVPPVSGAVEHSVIDDQARAGGTVEGGVIDICGAQFVSRSVAEDNGERAAGLDVDGLIALDA